MMLTRRPRSDILPPLNQKFPPPPGGMCVLSKCLRLTRDHPSLINSSLDVL